MIHCSRLFLSVLICALWMPFALSAAQNSPLEIRVSSERLAESLSRALEQYEPEAPVAVSVNPEPLSPEAFLEILKEGAAPDIYIGNHRQIGIWAARGLLAKIDFDRAERKAFAENSWVAFNHDEENWGLPLAMESVALVYNRELVEAAPTQLNDFTMLAEALSAKGIRAIAWDYRDPELTWGVVAANGGYIFGYDEYGHILQPDVGLNTPGAIQGMEGLLNLIGTGVLGEPVSRSAALEAMLEGQLAASILGPEEWTQLGEAGIHFATGVLPGVRNQTGHPLVTVTGAMVPQDAAQREAAIAFVKSQLASAEFQEHLAHLLAHSVTAHLATREKMAESDPVFAGYATCVDQGELFPNIAATASFLPLFGEALTDAIEKKASAKEALDQANRELRAAATGQGF